MDCSSPESLVQTPSVACICLSTPFLHYLGASCHAQCPPCHPLQETMALLRPRAAPFPGSPWGGLFAEGASPLPAPGRLGSNPGRQHLPPAGSALHTCGPCAEAERLQRAGAAAERHMLAFKSNQGTLEDENVRGRRDLRPRNCLARFALYKGGEYPRERSAHAFPCSWKLVTVCIGRVEFFCWWGFLGGFFCLFLFLLFMLLNALPARSRLR